MPKPVVTPSLFYQYATCPHWIWYDLYGDPERKGEVPELAKKLMEQGVVHEENYIRALEFVRVDVKSPAAAARQTLAFMKQGVPLIYQGVIETEIDGVRWRGKPDLLERVPGESDLGTYHYMPVDIKSSHSLHDEHKLQLAFYAEALAGAQGVRPEKAAILNVDHERITLSITPASVARTKRRVAAIVEIMSGTKPPLRLASKCKHSPWFKECIRSAEETNDIVLIYNLHEKTAEALRTLGIKTVAHAADMDVASLPKIPHASSEKLTRIKLQAESLIDRELKWLAAPHIPEAPLKLYFDIEGDPLLDVLYLFGFWVVGDPKGKYATGGRVRHDPQAGAYFLYFLAETPEEEEGMWKTFLAWLELLPAEGYGVYHYAPYEPVQTRRLAETYGGSEAFERFFARYVDLARVVQESVIFPLYFYSIKDLAKSPFLQYRWRNKKAGGAQSIFWYEEWLQKGDRAVLDSIIDYNEDDVVATQWLCDWLKQNARM